MQTSVDDTTVVHGLVLGNDRFLLDDRHSQPGYVRAMCRATASPTTPAPTTQSPSIGRFCFIADPL